MLALGNTRRVVLSALYAEVLRQGDPSPTHIEVLVKATEAHSVKRLDIVKMIVDLLQVGLVSSLHRYLAYLDLDEKFGEIRGRPTTPQHPRGR